jgi:VWFA-related protein
MLDVSRSVAERKHRIEGVLPFLRALGPADRASLGTFGAEIAVGANLTNDLSEFARVLNEEAWVDGGTPLWQAVSEAIRSLSGVSGRRAVLLYTDGADTGNLPNWGGNRSTVEREALASNCMVYFVRPIVRASERTRPLMDAAKTLAEMTGGGYYEVSHDDDQELEFRRVADELRHQYLLGFPPTAADGRMHRIEVRVSIPGMKARARSAYFALAEK